MIKEIIIITLIILLIYAYYQQNQPHILEDSPENKSLIKDLKGQVQHYQNLYQKRVAHDLDKNSVEIQTDNFIGESKETQTPFTLKYSRNTQTSLNSDNVDKLVNQWNQVATWAQELGIDTNKSWNLTLLKNKIKQELEAAKKPPLKVQYSRTTQTDDNPDSELETTLDNLLKNIQDLNKQL